MCRHYCAYHLKRHTFGPNDATDNVAEAKAAVGVEDPRSIKKPPRCQNGNELMCDHVENFTPAIKATNNRTWLVLFAKD